MEPRPCRDTIRLPANYVTAGLGAPRPFHVDGSVAGTAGSLFHARMKQIGSVRSCPLCQLEFAHDDGQPSAAGGEGLPFVLQCLPRKFRGTENTPTKKWHILIQKFKLEITLSHKGCLITLAVPWWVWFWSAATAEHSVGWGRVAPSGGRPLLPARQCSPAWAAGLGSGQSVCSGGTSPGFVLPGTLCISGLKWTALWDIASCISSGAGEAQVQSVF